MKILRIKFILVYTLILSCSVASVWALEERSLRVEGSIASDAESITLEWWQSEPNGPGAVSLYRRELGQTELETWQLLANLPAGTSTYTDKTTESGIAYEYQVLRPSTDMSSGDDLDSAGGYWTTGVGIHAIDDRGIVLLIVDETYASQLSLELDRLKADLRGDGWQVVTHETPRHGSFTDGRAAALKSWIQTEVAKNTSTQHALLLIGRVPYVLSGRDAPDGHDLVPHATDLYYADIDGNWTDLFNRGNNNSAGDGIMDNSTLPTNNTENFYWAQDGTNRIETWVGRIDFADMPSDPRDELTMLKDYLNKNHAYRQVAFPQPARSYWDSMAFDDSPTERYGAVNISGPSGTIQGEHLGTGQESPALWGIDFSDFNGSNYPDYDIQAIFAINFGSHKQKWHNSNNALRATLAQPWYVLAAGWGVRPNWYVHHMALGHPVGYSHFRTVNNGFNSFLGGMPEYNVVDDYGNQYDNAVWINLMGDPTVRAFMPAPPSKVLAVENSNTVELSWTVSPAAEIEGYKVYRSVSDGEPFIALNGGSLVTETYFTDSAPTAGATYMVRAYRLEQVHAGSFYNLSSGAFAKVGNAPPVPANIALSGKSGLPIEITLSATDADGDELLLSRSSRPSHGTVAGTGSNLVYTPNSGYYGSDTFTYSVWDGTTLTLGTVSLSIQEPVDPPIIESTPAYISHYAGANLTLEATLTGDLPMTFQWYKDGVALVDNAHLQGSNSAILKLISPRADASGYYHLSASNPVGTTDSAVTPIAIDIYEETPAQALILHYAFNEGAGTAMVDSSPSGKEHSTTNSSAVWTSEGAFGNALGPADLTASFPRFNPANADDLNFTPQAESYTFAVWVRTTTTVGYRGIFRKASSNPTNRQFQLWTANPSTTLHFYNGNSRGDVDTTNLGTPINNGDWHHLAAVNFYEPTTQTWKSRLYYDGVLGAEFDTGTGGKSEGAFEFGNVNNWHGQLDDFRVYRKALSESEISALYSGAQPESARYADWANAMQWNGADSSADATHPDSTMSNRLLYALDASTTDGSQVNLLPTIGIDENLTSEPKLNIDFRQRSLADDVRVYLESSSDLVSWTPLLIDGNSVSESVLEADPDGDGTAVLKRWSIDLREAFASQFIRLAVESR